ncbi:restriction endonuclease subunit S [Clostridium manihotivorum]|uniref:Restriction endonuclease subunit S n=1 Tax=Clostridium manihotivorum TaxID=2320868 RepID=A0A410DWV9_9CLOT|nr:restriction endonuclease subunit S [Clostridium manihotivorum]QAA33547.1 restriction endonuclease subunit S [Clostridium manihotivorum]
MIKLGDYIELISGRDLIKSQYNDKKKGIPYIMGASNMTNGELNIERWTQEPTVIGKNGDLIISVKGTVGELLILKEKEVHLSRQVMAIRPKRDYEVKFVFYYLKYYLDRLKEKAKGMIPGITRDDILDAEFVEMGKDEQRQVIKILDCAQALIDKRKEQIQSLDELVKSRFIEMFGDPVLNPKEWEKSTCKDISSKIGSGATPKGGNSSYKEEGISLIRSMNVHNNKFIKKDLAFIDEEQAQKLNNVTVEEEDILLNITGASVARCCIVPDELIPARVNQHVAIIRSKNERALPTFLLYQFTNESYQRLLWDIATSGGATREAVTKQQIENLELIVPPMELQSEFADFANQVDKLKFEMQKSLEELENNFNSLIQKAFNGELFK